MKSHTKHSQAPAEPHSGWKRLAVAATAVFAAFACSPPQSAQTPSETATPATESAAPNPALWRLADADTTIYLFGTIHVLPPSFVWRTPQIDEAFTRAGAVYFETDVNPALPPLQNFISTYGVYPPGVRLTDQLDAADRDLLESASRELGVPMRLIDNQRPWLAALTLAEQLILRVGYDPMSGVDRTLHAEAETAGKDIRKLETVEQQLLAFADLPEPVQIRYLTHGLKQVGEETEILGQLVEAWRVGDVEALDRIMIEGDLKDLPEVYESLMVRRNTAWIETLDALMREEAGVFFVAVGAGHLVGDDSLQAMLAARGHAVERLAAN